MNAVRLVDEISTGVGRVEVCVGGGLNLEVCDNGWDDNDARVVCRELGLLQDGAGRYFCV